MTESRERERLFECGSTVTVAELARDPYPVLARLREHEPISWVGAMGMWFVTRYDDFMAVLRDPETFTTDSPSSTIRDTFGSQMLSTDGADHGRYKRPCLSPFGTAAMEGTWTKAVSRLTRSLVDDFADKPSRQVDLMSTLAAPLSLRTMALVLDLPEESLPRLHEYYEGFASSLGNFDGDPGIRERGRQGASRLRAELAAHLEASRSRAEGADLTSRLAHEAGCELSAREITNNLLIVLFGGIETTESMIANAIWAVLLHPEALEAARADATFLEAAIEESLRWEPAVQSCTRHASRSCEIAGVAISKGDTVQCMVGGANRDPEVFAEPDRFDPQRYLPGSDTPRHLSFGLATHSCLGARLARLETRAALHELFERFPTLRLAPPADQSDSCAPYGHEFRKPRQLRIIW